MRLKTPALRLLMPIAHAVLALGLLCGTVGHAAENPQFGKASTAAPRYLEPLPRPISLQPYVDFWVQIYGVLDDGKAVIHDAQRTDKIYAVVDVPHGAGRAAKKAATAPEIRAYQAALRAVAAGAYSDNKYTQQVLLLWGKNTDKQSLLAAAERLRFQPGHADEFKRSLSRAAKVQPFIRHALREANIPLELDALPHVESFFRNDEKSSAGAIGIWQFTPTIGREYMRVDELLDERLDPRKSAVAAARLLKHNFEVTGNWPMAVTAYNHGTTGVLRAARELKTPDLGEIARRYTGESFGFASRNFYAAVLAAADVEASAHRYFGPSMLPAARTLSAHHAPPNTTLAALAKALALPLKTLQADNPALGKALRKSQLPLPAGYTVWLDCGSCEQQALTLEQLRRESPGSYRTLKIQAGDSLSIIAERNGIKSKELVTLNGLKSAHHIRAGQKLKLPWPSHGIEPQGEQLVLPASLRQLSDAPLLSTEELTTQHRWRHADAYRPDQRFGYKAQLAQVQQAQIDQGLVSLTAAGTLYSDANKYTVAKDSTVALQPGETIDHLAQWLELDPQSLFLINGLNSGAMQALGQRVVVVFDSISRAEFERRRKRYHSDKQRRFYADKKITREIFHEIKQGDQLWQIATARYGVPLWLLMEYNPALDFRTLRPGDKIRLPKLEARDNG